MSGAALPCHGGPMAGRQELAREGVAMYWAMPSRPGTPSRLIPNDAAVPYDEIRLAVGLYVREFAGRGTQRKDFLYFRAFPQGQWPVTYPGTSHTPTTPEHP